MRINTIGEQGNMIPLLLQSVLFLNKCENNV